MNAGDDDALAEEALELVHCVRAEGLPADVHRESEGIRVDHGDGVVVAHEEELRGRDPVVRQKRARGLCVDGLRLMALHHGRRGHVCGEWIRGVTADTDSSDGWMDA